MYCRYTFTGLPCVLPYVIDGVTQWDCLTNVSSSSNDDSSADSSSGDAASIGAAAVNAVLDRLGVCPTSSGDWGLCAPPATLPGQSK